MPECIPGADEIAVREALIALGVGPDADDYPVCSAEATDFHPEVVGTGRASAEESAALTICGDCNRRTACILEDLRTATSVEDIHGIRGGLRQSARRRLYRVLHRRAK
ncbi:WhiB family transcriptional regulator [Streptomyces sp. NPDC006656]|uniref:WhiB family transcriptional regulator n=1 Tax=Streptomyces sp. NPDC006656 TaxID=3156899 RepID=UPI003456730A